MKATINISVEVEDLGDLERVERALRFLSENGEGGYGVTVDEPPAKKKTPKKTTKKTAKTETEVEDLMGEEDDAPAPAVTKDDLQKAVRAKIESDGVEAVKSTFAQFKAQKLSDLKAKDYPAVLEALQE